MARDPVKISGTLDDNSVSNELFVGISDGTEQLLINADGSSNVTVNNASGASAVNIQDGGNSITIDDGGGSITVDGTVTATNPSVKVDDSAFTIATDSVTVLGALADETTPDSVDEGDVGALRMTLDRKLLTRIDNGAGAASVNIQDGGNVISIDDGAGSLTVDNSTLAVVGGGTEATALRVTIANDSTGLLSIDDNGGSITVDGAVTVSATDLDIRDLTHVSDSVSIGDGTDTLAVNADGSINVVVAGSSGTAIADYDQVAALASAGSDNHDYTAAGGAFTPSSVTVSGESIGTFDILANAVAIATLRTSVENPNATYEFPSGFSIADTQVLRVTRTNDSNKVHSFESTINGSQA